jgi:carbamoyl-phosphate synthase large subunit
MPVGLTILLSGAGGAAIPGIIEHLRSTGFRVLAADMDPLATGLYLSDRGFQVPHGDSPEFVEAVRKICQTERVDVFVPLVDEELIPAFEVESDRTKVLLPDVRFVRLALDKYALMRRLLIEEVPCPVTHLASQPGDDLYPRFVKPRRGRGSRGIGIVTNADSLASFISQSPYASDELVVQEFVEGTEYTVSVVVWRDGEVQAVVPKEIISKRGITHIAVAQKNQAIEAVCHLIQSKLHADGPFNVQLKIDNRTGEPKVFEINPRFSTTVSLTLAAGIDEIGGLARQAVRGREAWRFGEWRDGVALLRRTLDLFIPVEELNHRRREIVTA